MVRCLTQHVLDHNAHVGVEVEGNVKLPVLSVDHLTRDTDDFDGTIRLLDCAGAIPVLGHHGAVCQNLDYFSP